MDFEWDPNKAESNLRKHGVSFEESATVFRDFLSITVRDPDHSEHEERFLTVGQSVLGRILIVAHTEEDEDNRIRIVSARELTAVERKAYEEGELE